MRKANAGNAFIEIQSIVHAVLPRFLDRGIGVRSAIGFDPLVPISKRPSNRLEFFVRQHRQPPLELEAIYDDGHGDG